MKCPAIDANILLRFVRGDHPEQSAASRALLERVSLGKAEVFLPEVALCDAIWTLRSYYKLSREDIASFAEDLIALAGIKMTRKTVAKHAVSLFGQTNIDFSDALIAAEMVHDERASIYSYDRDFDRVAGIKRVEP